MSRLNKLIAVCAAAVLGAAIIALAMWPNRQSAPQLSPQEKAKLIQQQREVTAVTYRPQPSLTADHLIGYWTESCYDCTTITVAFSQVHGSEFDIRIGYIQGWVLGYDPFDYSQRHTYRASILGLGSDMWGLIRMGNEPTLGMNHNYIFSPYANIAVRLYNSGSGPWDLVLCPIADGVFLDAIRKGQLRGRIVPQSREYIGSRIRIDDTPGNIENYFASVVLATSLGGHSPCKMFRRMDQRELEIRSM